MCIFRCSQTKLPFLLHFKFVVFCCSLKCSFVLAERFSLSIWNADCSLVSSVVYERKRMDVDAKPALLCSSEHNGT